MLYSRIVVFISLIPLKGLICVISPKKQNLDACPLPPSLPGSGNFPNTAEGLEQERYAFVSLDADLYAPLLAGLEYFYPRLSSGGAILLHDYNNQRFRGASMAVDDFEKKNGAISLVPLCDLHGSAVILHP